MNSLDPTKNLSEYILDFRTKAACERYFERIIEAVMDLAFLVIRINELRTPENDRQAFDILAKNNLINPTLASRLSDA